MALHPYTWKTKDTLMPGAHGELFQETLPGYRTPEDRMNRPNAQLSTCAHDRPNTKYELDRRLPGLFRYGYARGYNLLSMPKGRIVAIDPHVNQLSFDDKKSWNVLTLANGGNVVKRRTSGDTKQWEPVSGEYTTTAGGEQIYRTGTIDVTGDVTTDPRTGKCVVDSAVRDDYIAANRPIGMITRNEYTRDDNAYNGMAPGAIMTDAMVELPLFALKSKAEVNPWGSIYGNILPGDLVKSDENGRVVVSPLSRPEILATMTAPEIEMERQQVIGQVYQIERDLVPMGAAKYVQWALSDRMNFDQYNPFMWRATNRSDQDINYDSPYGRTGGGAINEATSTTGIDPFEPTGYGYDNTLSDHDMHMLASTARNSDIRMGIEFELENGIPGVSDGYNVFSRQIGPECIGTLRKSDSVNNYHTQFFKLSELNAEKGTLEIAVTDKLKNDLTDDDFTAVTVKSGQTLDPEIEGNKIGECLTVTYMNELQGFLAITVTDKDTFHNSSLSPIDTLNVYARYRKRGLAGVPSFMDWDGCVGRASILLQR